MKKDIIFLASIGLMAACSNPSTTEHSLQPKVDSLQAELKRLISKAESSKSEGSPMSQMTTDHIMTMPKDIQWGDPPPGLPPGAKVAAIEGDPGASGLFTMRIKFPANYKIMPHTHPADEHVTVIEGTLNMGMGDTYDEKKCTEMHAGAFAALKKGTAHYIHTKGECIVQVHGVGPWGIIYVNAADDPRNKK
jgi:quercetin dioxygenase-like cupin family protein